MKLQTHVILSNNLYTTIRYTLLDKKNINFRGPERLQESFLETERKKERETERERKRQRVVSKLQGVHGKVS